MRSHPSLVRCTLKRKAHNPYTRAEQRNPLTHPPTQVPRTSSVAHFPMSNARVLPILPPSSKNGPNNEAQLSRNSGRKKCSRHRQPSQPIKLVPWVQPISVAIFGAASACRSLPLVFLHFRDPHAPLVGENLLRGNAVWCPVRAAAPPMVPALVHLLSTSLRRQEKGSVISSGVVLRTFVIRQPVALIRTLKKQRKHLKNRRSRNIC